MTADRAVQVRLLRFPLRLHVRSRAHFEELMREFQLVDLGLAEGFGGVQTVPQRLLELVDQFTHRYRDRVDAIEAQRAEAIALGKTHMDLVYDAPLGARDAIAAIASLMDECDEFCRSDDYLLTMATPDDVAAFRRWNVGEILTQLEGGAPTPWSGT